VRELAYDRTSQSRWAQGEGQFGATLLCSTSGSAKERELPPLPDGGQGTLGVGHEVARFSPGEVDGATVRNDNAPTEAGGV